MRLEPIPHIKTPLQKQRSWLRRVRLAIPMALSLFAADIGPARAQEVIDPRDIPSDLNKSPIPGPRIVDEKGNITTDDTHGWAGPRFERPDISAKDRLDILKGMEGDLQKKLEQFKARTHDDQEYIKRWKEDYRKMFKDGTIETEAEVQELQKGVDDLYEALTKGYEKVGRLLDDLAKTRDAYNADPSDEVLQKRLGNLLKGLRDFFDSLEALEFDFNAFDETEALRETPPSPPPSQKIDPDTPSS